MTTAKQQRRARKKARRPALHPDHDAALVAVICAGCGRHQFNRKAGLRSSASPVAGCIQHAAVDELAGTVVTCKGCDHPYGRYL